MIRLISEYKAFRGEFRLSTYFLQEDRTMKQGKSRSIWRLALFLTVIWMMTWGFSAVANAQTGAACTRENLKAVTDKYFAALVAHDPSAVPLDPKVRYTENAKEIQVGKGIWETAAKVLLKRGLVDTERCGTHTQAVLEENGRPILFGTRLQVLNNKVTEIESFIAREKEFAFELGGAKGVLETKDQDWETIIPKEQRSSRQDMIAAANNYYDMFSNDPKVFTPFAKVCDRWENGFQTTKGGMVMGKETPAHDCSPKGLVITNHGPRRFLVDQEQGVVVAYVLFAGGLPDFHMFRMRSGKVDIIQAVIGAGAPSIGWPIEPLSK